ncbi:hypothetical protein Taro_053338, partial [Colocasia esculenta]|nr:hypothetical protein [Colocasia esculenta]
MCATCSAQGSGHRERDAQVRRDLVAMLRPVLESGRSRGNAGRSLCSVFFAKAVVMADRRDWGGGGEGPEELTQRMIERIWESLTEIRMRMDQQALVPPVTGEAVPMAPVPPPPGVEVPFVAPVPPSAPVIAAEKPVVQIERFLRLQPPTYYGGPNPDTSEHWIHEIERVFMTMRCPAVDRVVLATFQLRRFAQEWWRLKMQTTFAGRVEGKKGVVQDLAARWDFGSGISDAVHGAEQALEGLSARQVVIVTLDPIPVRLCQRVLLRAAGAPVTSRVPGLPFVWDDWPCHDGGASVATAIPIATTRCVAYLSRSVNGSRQGSAFGLLTGVLSRPDAEYRSAKTVASERVATLLPPVKVAGGSERPVRLSRHSGWARSGHGLGGRRDKVVVAMPRPAPSSFGSWRLKALASTPSPSFGFSSFSLLSEWERFPSRLLRRLELVAEWRRLVWSGSGTVGARRRRSWLHECLGDPGMEHPAVGLLADVATSEHVATSEEASPRAGLPLGPSGRECGSYDSLASLYRGGCRRESAAGVLEWCAEGLLPHVFDFASSVGVVFGLTRSSFASTLLEFLLLWLVASFPTWSGCELQESVAAVAGCACFERGYWFARAAFGFVVGLCVRVGVSRRLREPACGVAFTSAGLWSVKPVEGVLALLAVALLWGESLLDVPLVVGVCVVFGLVCLCASLYWLVVNSGEVLTEFLSVGSGGRLFVVVLLVAVVLPSRLRCIAWLPCVLVRFPRTVGCCP